MLWLDLCENDQKEEAALLEQQFGFEETITQVVYPFLDKIGILWQTGNITPAHEHFISNLIRQKIIDILSPRNWKFNHQEVHSAA